MGELKNEEYIFSNTNLSWHTLNPLKWMRLLVRAEKNKNKQNCALSIITSWDLRDTSKS